MKDIEIPIKSDVAKLKAKVLSLNPNYIIYENGKVWSNNSDKWLSPIKIQQKNGRTHYCYDIKPIGSVKSNRKQIISRLVYFTFAKHKYKNILELPDISYIDLDPTNYHISNLDCIGKAGVLAKYEIGKSTRLNGRNNKTAISPQEKENVKKLLINTPKSKIALIYNCSPMAVYRYCLIHELIKIK